MTRRLGGALALVMSLASAGLAQPTPAKPAAPAKKKAVSVADLEASVEALRAEVQALAAGAGDAAAARSATTELEARVIALASEVAELRRSAQTAPESRQVIDALAERVTKLEEQMDEVRALAALPAPPPPDPEVGTAPAGNGLAGYDDGFTLCEASGRFALRLNGYVRTRWLLDHAGDTRDEITATGFSVHRARASLSGHAWSPKIAWRAQLELTDAQTPLRDGYLEYRARRELALRGGQFRVPLMRQFLTPITNLVFADRSLVTQLNAPTRDLGVSALGQALGKKLGYWLAITNGAGQNAANDNIDLRYTGRIAVAPLGEVALEEGDLRRTRKPLVEVSVAAMYDLTPNGDVNGDDTIDNAQIFALGAGLVARTRGISLEAEYLARFEDEGGGRAKETRHGAYAQLSARVWRHLVIGARGGFVQPTPIGRALAARVDLAETRWEGTGVVMWANPEPVKLQAEFTIFQDEFALGSDRVLHRGLAQAQVEF